MPYIGNVPAEAYSQVSYQDLTGGSGTSFTLDYPVGSAGEIEVFVNNVRQEPTVAYTVSGTSLTMTGSITATDDFYVVFQGKAQQTIGIPEKQTDGTYVFPDDVLVGKSASSFNATGLELESQGRGRFTRDGGVAVQLNRLTSDGDLAVFYKDGAEVGSIGTFSGDIAIGNDDIGLHFNASGNNILPANLTTSTWTDGTANLGGGSQRFNSLFLSGGVFLGGTGSANLLDDYEEGTWTPTSVQGSVTAFSNATYTKIGDTVHLSVSGIRLSDTTTASPIQIGGQPFAISNRAIGAMMIRYAGSTIGHSIYMAGSYMEPTQTLNSGSWNNLQHSDLTSSSCDLYFSITYKTAA